ncbi:serine/threonine protein kinase [Arthrobacter rhombi]|uniref:Serine/threonine protein kinase n=1 Tax=Arthrobacter rhombi TaxID=71253 RepID=A0A1R4GNB9_9MICC|nr:serine/threonine-protein kinase [Arthrobacter rhombi]SJM69710.1 serine/threonine protein kinase [Arthrobacter rhombi]
MDAPNEWKRRPELKDWALEHELGRGTSGTVYVVRQRHTGDRAALKLGVSETSANGAYSQEVQALAAMKHQHIVELIGAVSTDQGEGILMEYLPGGSVADLISARGPLTLGETVTVIAPLAGALAFLHEHGAVHGDISPGNVLFTAEGKPKLADLGLAVLVGGRQEESGTPGFKAPSTDVDELGGRRLQPARDVYSLAALAWYMVTGRVAGPTQHRPPLSSLLGGVPSELVELLESALSEDEDDRPGAQEFGRRIFHIAKPQPVNLRQAVRTEALGQMVTDVVADPARQRAGRRPAAWIRRALPLRRNRNRRQGRSMSVPGLSRRIEGRGRGDGRRRGSRAERGTRRGVRMAAFSAATVLLCLLVAGLVLASVDGRDPDSAPAAQSAVTTLQPTAAPVSEQGVAGEPPAAAATSESSSGPRLTKVLETPVFSAPVPDDPVKAARVLTARRDLALAEADPAALRQVHATGGNSLGPDLAISSQLRARGLHYRGLETLLTHATVNKGSEDARVEVAATSIMSAYQIVGADGAMIQSVSEPEEQDIILILERVDGGWLIDSVVDASGSPGIHG